MKNKIQILSVLTVPLFTSGPVQAASAIASVDVLDQDGNIVTLAAGVTNDTQFAGTSSVLQTFTSGGLTYGNLVGADGFAAGATGGDGDVEGVLYGIGGTAPTAAVALTDLNLSTGTLDPYGDGTVLGPEFFDFSSQAIGGDTIFFLFANATPSQVVALVDSNGGQRHLQCSISGDDDLGGEVQLSDFGFSRTNGGDLAGREVFGNIFLVSDFTLNDGSTVADIAGFRGQGGTFDAQDAGIAFVVPEPSSALLLLGGLGTFFVRRRR